MKVAALVSGGKDSWCAAYLAKRNNHEISCIISLSTERESSWVFQPNSEFVSFQAEAADLPLIMMPVEVSWIDDLKEALNLAKGKHKIEAVVAGILSSHEKMEKLETACAEAGLKLILPLWNMGHEQYLRSLILYNFDVLLTSINYEGLNPDLIGKKLDRNLIDELKKANITEQETKAYETFVLDCPLFNKKIEVWNSQPFMENANKGRLVIQEVQLRKK